MITTIWKKLAAAVFWLISGALVLITAATHHEAHRARHARPAEPKPDDGQTVDWLRAIASPLRKRVVPPLAVAGTWVAAFAAVMPRTPNPVGATAPHPNETGPSVGSSSVPRADVDTYLTDDALRHGFNFEAEHPVLPGEHHPPWPGPFIDGHDIGPGFVVEPTLPPLPEPAADWKPHACGDVDQPTAILRAQAERHATVCADCGHDAPHTSTLNATCTEGECGCREFPATPPATQDVPGPAESASPAPPGGAEAASPPAVVAGPGTPSCDDTAADRAFVADVAARPLDWAAWLHVCQHGDIDTVRAVTQ